MDTVLTNLLNQWETATSKAPWGVQKVFHDVFTLASEGKTTLIYGSDYRDGKPCLVNTVGTMLTSGGGVGVPMRNFHDIVSLFDRINERLFRSGVNDTDGYVSPLAADVFLQHFSALKEKPLESAVNEAVAPEAFANGVYVEPTDEDFARDLVNMFMTDAPCEITIDESDLTKVEVRNLEA